MKRRILSGLLCLAVVFSLIGAVPVSAKDLQLPKLEVVSLTPNCSPGPKETHEISSGSATWSWIPDSSKPDQITGIAIDAIAPWMWAGTTTVPAGMARLKWDVSPDKVSIVSCEVKDYKNSSPVLVKEPAVKYPYLIRLKANRFYIITAQWNESHLKSDGGCGTVDYSFKT